MRELSDRNKLYGRVLDALRAWNSTRGDSDEMLADLLLVRQEREKMSQQARPIIRLATNRVLYRCMEELGTHDRESADILIARFPDGMQVLETALRFNYNEDQFKRRQRQAIKQLTDVVIAAETRLRNGRMTQWESILPPLPQETFGLEKALSDLTQRLIDQDDMGVVVINGIGGIGKTHLALVAAYQILTTFLFEGVIWVRVDPYSGRDPAALENHLNQIFHQIGRQLVIEEDDPPILSSPQIYSRLKAAPHLVVIDNIEFFDELDVLLEGIGSLIFPSKFLITSRVRADVRHPIFHLTLGQLNPQASLALIASQARQLGIAELEDPDSTWAATLFEYLGGHPQALRMVISLATVLPLSEILADFKATDSKEVQNLYHHIYEQSWRLLSPAAQEVLESLTLGGSDGMVLSQLQAVVDLSRADLLNGIAELAKRSLVELLGSAERRRYAIHRLTEAFLRSDIINLPGHFSKEDGENEKNDEGEADEEVSE